MKMMLGLGLASIAVLGASAQAQEKPKAAAPANAPRAARIAPASVRTPPTQEELVKRRDEKMAEAWVRNAAWFTDYDEARKTAAEQSKQILAYFTRSYSP